MENVVFSHIILNIFTLQTSSFGFSLIISLNSMYICTVIFKRNSDFVTLQQNVGVGDNNDLLVSESGNLEKKVGNCCSMGTHMDSCY